MARRCVPFYRYSYFLLIGSHIALLTSYFLLPQEDAGWLERAGTPQPPGRFTLATEVAQVSAEEGVAFWLRGKNAKLFSVGELERHCIGVQGQKQEDGTPLTSYSLLLHSFLLHSCFLQVCRARSKRMARQPF